MDNAHRRPRGNRDSERSGRRPVASRGALAYRKPANDNRFGLKGWIERIAALAFLIGLAALLAWKIAG